MMCSRLHALGEPEYNEKTNLKARVRKAQFHRVEKGGEGALEIVGLATELEGQELSDWPRKFGDS